MLFSQNAQNRLQTTFYKTINLGKVEDK